MYDRYCGDGTYYTVDATGSLLDLPTTALGCKVIVSDADCYCRPGGAALVLGDCKVPASSGDPCSDFRMNGETLRLSTRAYSKIAIKAASGTAKVWLVPFEEVM